MPTTPPVTQSIGQTAGTLRRLVKRVLAGTDTTFDQWMALNLAAASGEGIEHTQLVARLADAVQVDDPVVATTVSGLIDGGSLETSREAVVALSGAGRDRYLRIRALIVEATEPLTANIPADRLAATQGVLQTLSERANAVLAGG
jgi:hypothetical protein